MYTYETDVHRTGAHPVVRQTITMYINTGAVKNSCPQILRTWAQPTFNSVSSSPTVSLCSVHRCSLRSHHLCCDSLQLIITPQKLNAVIKAQDPALSTGIYTILPSAIDMVQYKDGDGGTIDCKLIPHLMGYYFEKNGEMTSCRVPSYPLGKPTTMLLN